MGFTSHEVLHADGLYLWDALADGRPLQDAGVWQEARQRFQQRLEGHELERTARGWRTLK